MAEEGRVDKESIIRALMEAMTGEAGKTISDADRMRMQRLKGMAKPQGMKMPERMKTRGRGDMDLSPEQMKMLELMMKRQQGVREAEERKAFPPPSMMKKGGEVKRKKNPKMGAVMKGRGGSYKGTS